MKFWYIQLVVTDGALIIKLNIKYCFSLCTGAPRLVSFLTEREKKGGEKEKESIG